MTDNNYISPDVTIIPRANRIPRELRDLDQWVLWCLEANEKIPYDPSTGQRAKSNDPRTWTSFETACQALFESLGHYDGLGFMFSADDGLCGVDLDDCRDPENGQLLPLAQRVIDHHPTYMEVSPSNTGVKAWYTGQISDFWQQRPQWVKTKYGVEVYWDERFFTVTTRTLPTSMSSISPITPDFIDDLARLAAGTALACEMGPSNRHNSSAALAGWLLRNEWSDDDVREFCLHVATRNGGDVDDQMTFVESTIKKYRDGDKNVTGFSTLIDSVDHMTVRNVAMWLDLQSGTRANADDFIAHPPNNAYIYRPTRALWPAASIDKVFPPIQVGTKPNGDPLLQPMSTWLSRNQAVQQMAWAPGEPEIIENRLLVEGGWSRKEGDRCFNLYKPQTIEPGDPEQATRWIDHVRWLYPEDADHIIDWCAHRVQRPQEKINHAIVLGGEQGIGKDTILEPVRYAVGPWNWSDVSPTQLMGRFNGFVKSVIVVVSEARDLGDTSRYSFYDHMKTYLAAPPYALRCDEKNIPEYYVLNVCGIVYTTNHRWGLYLPRDDRRHYVTWSEVQADEVTKVYFNELYEWYENGGYEHVAAYLMTHDLSIFNPKAPPPKTPGFWDMVDANAAPEASELADLLDQLGNPDAVTVHQLVQAANGNITRPYKCETNEETFEKWDEVAARVPVDYEFGDWLSDRSNRRKIPHQMDSVGYVAVVNDSAQDQKWKINGKRHKVYAKKELSPRERIEAVKALSREATEAEAAVILKERSERAST